MIIFYAAFRHRVREVEELDEFSLVTEVTTLCLIRYTDRQIYLARNKKWFRLYTVGKQEWGMEICDLELKI